MWGIFLSIVILILIYIYLTKSFNYWKEKHVPFEKPVPIFGNLLSVALRQEQMGYLLKRIYDNYYDAPYFGIFSFNKPVLVVKSKEMIKNVMIRDFSSFINRTTYVNEDVDPLSANVLFALKNDDWRALRNKLTPVFTSGKMKMMYTLVQEVAVQLNELLCEMNGKEIDVRNILNRYTVDVISTCAFGINANSIKNENAEIKKQAERLLDQKGFTRTFSMFAWFFCPILVSIFRLSFVERKSSKFLIDVFKQSAEDRRKSNTKRNDLIDILNAIKEEEKEDDLFKFDDVRLYAQAIVFFNAGAEGTRSMLTMCLYELALNSDIQDTLRKEIRKNLEVDGLISYESLFEMEYLDLVVKETLRKYPFIQFIIRYAEKNYTFSTGLEIEQETQVMIPMLALHYDPQYYPNPEKFDPERFRGDKMKDLQYVYLPFGDGPRKCIGDRFALMSMKVGLATFLKDFMVTPGERTEIPINFSKSAIFATPSSGSVFLKVQKIE